ncbi:barstar family protein [Streptosporangium sp. NBC_01639]|uniref:barstar family protein n=1 Tax=Streptosporangium sp. NBC_01639 TaxID=2975948 RepID=UPI00386C398A|nr:barstar family protein [Streptosporangium sp. NBC_01639]
MSVEWVDVNKLIPGLPLPPYLIQKETAAEVVAALTRSGFVVGELDGHVINSQRDLLEKIGKVLEFPDYYGCNWDALTDCAGDLPRQGKPKVALVWHDSDLLLRRSVHDFVRSMTLMYDIAKSTSTLPPDAVDPDLQMEVFFSGEW